MYLISAFSTYFNSLITGKLQLTLLREVSECAYSAVQSASLKSTQNIKVGDLITWIMGNTQIAINIPVGVIPNFSPVSQHYRTLPHNDVFELPIGSHYHESGYTIHGTIGGLR